LYFEITDKDKKCFIEELPDDTQMIGKYLVQIFDRQAKVTFWTKNGSNVELLTFNELFF